MSTQKYGIEIPNTIYMHNTKSHNIHKTYIQKCCIHFMCLPVVYLCAVFVCCIEIVHCGCIGNHSIPLGAAAQLHSHPKAFFSLAKGLALYSFPILEYVGCCLLLLDVAKCCWTLINVVGH